MIWRRLEPRDRASSANDHAAACHRRRCSPRSRQKPRSRLKRRRSPKRSMARCSLRGARRIPSPIQRRHPRMTDPLRVAEIDHAMHGRAFGASRCLEGRCRRADRQRPDPASRAARGDRGRGRDGRPVSLGGGRWAGRSAAARRTEAPCGPRARAGCGPRPRGTLAISAGQGLAAALALVWDASRLAGLDLGARSLDETE